MRQFSRSASDLSECHKIAPDRWGCGYEHLQRSTFIDRWGCGYEHLQRSTFIDRWGCGYEHLQRSTFIDRWGCGYEHLQRSTFIDFRAHVLRGDGGDVRQRRGPSEGQTTVPGGGHLATPQ